MTPDSKPLTAASELRPIDRMEEMDRTYIPLPGNWEIQTKGKGSSFRLYDGKKDLRMPISPQPYLFDMLERMARDVHAAYTDLESRLASAEASAARYLWLRDKSNVVLYGVLMGQWDGYIDEKIASNQEPTP